MKQFAGVVAIAKKYRYPLLLTLTIILAAYLRLHGLANNPPALSQDEVVNGYDAYSIGHTLHDHHGIFLPRTLGSFGDSASVALTYLTIPFVLIGGLTEWAVRLPIALSGIATVGLIYLLIKEVSGRRNAALLGAFILAIVPWNVTLTRWAIPPVIVPVFLLLFLWLFACAVQRTRHKLPYLIGAALAASALTYSYPSAEVFAPVFLLAISVIYFYDRLKLLITSYVIYGLSVLPLFWLIIFEPNSNFARFDSVKLTSTGLNFVSDVLTRYRGYFSFNFYFGPTGNNPMMHVPGVGNFYIFLGIFLLAGGLLGIYKLCRHWGAYTDTLRGNRRLISLIITLLLWALLGPLPASVSIDQQHVTRDILMFPLVTLAVTFAIYYVIKNLSQRSWQIAMAALFVVLSFASLWQYEHIYNHTYPQMAAQTEFQYGVKQGLEYILPRQQAYNRITIDTSINQPYIYYLFYANYNPTKINYDQTNTSFVHKVPYIVPQIGKFYFEPVTKDSVHGAKVVKNVTGYGKTWFTIYQKNDQLIMKKDGTLI